MKQVVTLDTRSEFEKIVDNLTRETKVLVDLMGIHSKLAKAQFDSLVESGFTVEQAMDIVTKQPSWKV